MLNITLQCCAMFMLVVLFVIFARERVLDLSSSRLYYYALVSSIICISLDIISIVGIWAADEGYVAPVIARIICKLYVMSLVVQSYEGFLYSAGEFFSASSHRITRRFYQISLVVGLALVAILPISYYINGREVYSYGPSTTATYFFALLYILSTIAMAFTRNESTSQRRRRAILLWEFAWLLAALIQLLNADLLLVGFAGAFGMLILYAELENPHAGIDRASGLFSANALLDYVTDRYQTNQPFASLTIRYDHPTQTTDWETEKTMLVRAANFFKGYPQAYTFRNDENEFVMIFPQPDDLDAVLPDIYQTIYHMVHMPLRFKYAVIPDSTIADHAEEFFKLHHYLMDNFEEKETVVANEDAITHIREYAVVKAMIESALAEDRVDVFFQPMYNTDKRKFTTAEALVRIRDTDGSIVPPGKFIPVAEENGLIIPLGEEIFRQVCALLATGEPMRLGIEYIEVNLSVAQFDQENLADTFFDIADAYGVDSAVINLEITETASTSAKKILLNNMKKFLDKGVRFSLDDFGTGRSNLDYFIEMPVDIIKFDYTFTQSYFTNQKARDVMESVIGMFHRMGLKIVSEGVETKEQLDAMCALGINYIQGFYFSKPVPKDEFLAFLKEKNGAHSS